MYFHIKFFVPSVIMRINLYRYAFIFPIAPPKEHTSLHPIRRHMLIYSVTTDQERVEFIASATIKSNFISLSFYIVFNII